MKKKTRHSFHNPHGLNRYHYAWSQKEEDLLRKLYPDSLTPKLEKYFGRSSGSIIAKARKLGIKKSWRKHNPLLEYNRPIWTKKEIKLLKKLYHKYSNEQLVQYFPKRKKDSIGRRANMLGLKKKYLHHFERPKNSDAKLWLKQKELLKKLYPTTSNQELAKKIGRSKAAIANLAWKMGLHKEGYNPGINRTGGNVPLWSQKNDALLRKSYPTAWTKDLSIKLGRSEKAIIARAMMLGVRKKHEFTRFPRPEDWTTEEINKARQLWQQGEPTTSGL
jgi:hypothetical protein